MVNAEVRAIVKNLGKDIEFLQPVYEAIVNSLEANATEIIVNFFLDEQQIFDGFEKRINSFQVIDNGEGFIEQNIDSFNNLWSTRKIEKGCKGSGRFTWLNVFENILIHSELKDEKAIIEIPFSLDYDKKTNTTPNDSILRNKTVVTFNNVTKKMLNTEKKIDRREIANIDRIYEKIFNYLMVKLFLIKNEGKQFKITLQVEDKIRYITNNDVPNLTIETFEMDLDIKSTYESPIKFELYYDFIKDSKKKRQLYFCANGRIVENIDDESLGLSSALPNGDSLVVLLCSDYFDDNVDDGRNNLEGLKGLKNRTFDRPLLLTDIKFRLKLILNKIILTRYPNITNENMEIKNKAINQVPYLTKFINENDDILITEDSLIKYAKNKFNKVKEPAKARFEKLLKDADVNIDNLQLSVGEVSEMALAELGEYIKYREAIIKALDAAILDKEKKESFIHKIFMPKGTTSKDLSDYALNNIWILDDKFMTFTYAASDVEINKIVEEIEKENSKREMGTKKPDLTILYNKTNNRDAVVIEFKGLNTTLGEKEKAIGEIGRNVNLIRKNISELNTIWGYIITTIDDDFGFSLISNGYKKLFTNSKDGKIYYSYNDTAMAHIYALDIRAITSDALARNQTFLNILKQQ